MPDNPLVSSSLPQGVEALILQAAQRIAYEDTLSEHWWTSNHSCGSHGCCGGGKEVDRADLRSLVVAEMVSLVRALEQGRDQAPAPAESEHGLWMKQHTGRRHRVTRGRDYDECDDCGATFHHVAAPSSTGEAQ